MICRISKHCVLRGIMTILNSNQIQGQSKGFIGFQKTLHLKVRNVQRRVIHENIHMLTKFKSPPLIRVQGRVTAAVMDIGRNILLNIWAEQKYCWNVYVVTKSAHIQHL